MAEYSYRTVDLKTNQVLEDVDLTNVKIQRKLSAVGSLTADLFIPDGQRGRLLELATTPGRTGIYALRNDVPLWGGVIWKRDWNERDFTYALNCGSWESYAYHLVQINTFQFSGVDQLQIAYQLLSNSQLTQNSQISFPNLTSGFKRDRSMFSYERKTVGAELDALAKLENGFDYRVANYLDTNGALARRYEFGYPTFGKTLTNTSADLIFSYPGNLQPYKHTEDAENSGWRAYGVGAGEGTDTVLATSADNRFLSNGWPLLETVSSYKTVERYDTLLAHTQADLKDTLPPIESYTFQLTPESELDVFDISEGDRAIFSIGSRRWDTPRAFTARIALIDITPEDDETLETIAVGLVDGEDL